MSQQLRQADGVVTMGRLYWRPAYCPGMYPAMPPFATLVFCTSHVAGPAEWAARYRRWLDHHRAQPWGDALWCLMDDASPWQPPADEVQMVAASAALPAEPGLPLMVRFEDHLGLQPGRRFPGWWRSFVHSVAVARHHGCSRIIHIESDAYVLTRRMQGFLAGRTAGWTAKRGPAAGTPSGPSARACGSRLRPRRPTAGRRSRRPRPPRRGGRAGSA
jgi:hypothetical protein